jgi:hypothetical protein
MLISCFSGIREGRRRMSLSRDDLVESIVGPLDELLKNRYGFFFLDINDNAIEIKRFGKLFVEKVKRFLDDLHAYEKEVRAYTGSGYDRQARKVTSDLKYQMMLSAKGLKDVDGRLDSASKLLVAARKDLASRKVGR